MAPWGSLLVRRWKLNSVSLLRQPMEQPPLFETPCGFCPVFRLLFAHSFSLGRFPPNSLGLQHWRLQGSAEVFYSHPGWQREKEGETVLAGDGAHPLCAWQCQGLLGEPCRHGRPCRPESTDARPRSSDSSRQSRYNGASLVWFSSGPSSFCPAVVQSDLFVRPSVNQPLHGPSVPPLQQHTVLVATVIALRGASSVGMRWVGCNYLYSVICMCCAVCCRRRFPSLHPFLSSSFKLRHPDEQLSFAFCVVSQLRLFQNILRTEGDSRDSYANGGDARCVRVCFPFAIPCG